MFIYVFMYVFVFQLTASYLCSYVERLNKTTVKLGQHNQLLTDIRTEDKIPHMTSVMKRPFRHASWNICN